MTDADRRAMLAKVHIARKDLGLDDDTYRDVIERISTGRARSAKDLRYGELNDLLREFRDKGWKPKAATAGGGAAKDAQSRKVWALWFALADAGVVRNRSAAALRAYVKRMVDREDLRFCDQKDKAKLIEELKAWCDRAGVEFVR